MENRDSEKNVEPAQHAPSPVVRVTAPFRDELLKSVERLRIEPVLIEQLQDHDLSAGHVRVRDQLLVRLDLPSPSDNYGVAWKRLDSVLTSDLGLLVQPQSLKRVDEAFGAAKSLPADQFLVRVATAIANAYDDMRVSLEHEDEAMRRGTSTSKRALRMLHEDSDELMRGAKGATQNLEELTDVLRFSPDAYGALRAAIARLEATESRVMVLKQRLPPAPPSAEEEVPLDVESPEIVETAIALGQKRLHRMTLGHMITALIGGLAVSFGAAAMAWTGGAFMTSGFDKAHLIGSIAFPIGFVILIVGKGELFTENFFVPVSGAMSGNGKWRDLAGLWASTLVFNLIGALVFAFLITRPGVLPEGATEFFKELGHHKVAGTWGALFVKGIFAGWLMTMLTWLLLATKEMAPRLIIISMLGFLIAAGHLNHVVISASESFIAIGLKSGVTVHEWFFRNFLAALSGNVVGGIVFVTVLGYLQAHLLKHSEEKMKQAFHDQKRRESH